MVVTDYNEMSIKELEIINAVLGREYVIEGGRITEVIDANEKKN